MFRGLYFGYFSCVCITSAYQDMLGKELYIKKVSEYWTNTSPWLWGFIWLLGFIFFVYVEIKEKR